MYKLAWGSLFAKGLKKQWERNGAIITTVRNIVVSSLILVHGQSFAQCALGFFKIRKNNDFMNNVLG